MTIKLLTGQHIHEAFNENSHWHEMSDTPLGLRMQKRYNQIAKGLNQDLGLCESCGERPIAPNTMLEVAGDNVCSDCCAGPENDPKAQYMHMVFNPNNTLAGVVTPPAGMSLEAYQALLKEEMSHISFVLEFESEKYTSKSYIDLYKHVDENIPVPSSTQAYEYSIHVMKDDKEIGLGKYKCANYDRFENIGETGAAEGLIDALDEYNWAVINAQAPAGEEG